jgi:hypothetical protein
VISEASSISSLATCATTAAILAEGIDVSIAARNALAVRRRSCGRKALDDTKAGTSLRSP